MRIWEKKKSADGTWERVLEILEMSFEKRNVLRENGEWPWGPFLKKKEQKE